MQSSLITTRDQLAEQFATQEFGLIRVKPRVIFQAIEEVFHQPIPLQLQIPSSGLGSVTMLEAALLVSVLRLTKPTAVVEFGTFLGYSTRLFLDNTEKSTSIISIDLPIDYELDSSAGEFSDAELHSDDHKNDEYLRHRQRTTGAFYLSGLDSQESRRLSLIKADSKTLQTRDIAPPGSAGFVFVDGGHDEGLVVNDSRLAKSLIGDDGVIIWHDFGSSIHGDVTQAVLNIAKSSIVIAIENTLIAMQICGNVRGSLLGLV